MTFVDVQRAIEAKKAELTKRHNVNLDDHIRGLETIAGSDIGELFDGSGAVLPPSQWPKNIAKAVADFKIVERIQPDKDGTRQRVVSIRLRDKLPALKKLIDIALAGDREAIPGTRANTDVNRDALIGAQLDKLYGRSVVEN